MLYDLSNIIDRERFRRKSEALLEKRYVAELTSKKPRSLKQNSYLHVLIAYFALETGNTKTYVKDEYFKRLSNPDIFIKRKYDKLLQRETTELLSSRDITQPDMAIAITRFRNWSSQEADIYLPEAHEREYLQACEVEISKHKEYI